MKLKVLFTLICLLLSTFALAEIEFKFKSQIEITPAEPGIENPVNFRVKIKCARSAADNIKVEAKIDGARVWSDTIAHMDLDEERWINFGRFETAGTHTVVFILDPDNDFNEVSETNNERAMEFTVAGEPGTGGIGDVHISVITATITAANECNGIDFSIVEVTSFSAGMRDGSSKSGSVKFYYSLPAGCKPGRILFNLIDAHETVIATFTKNLDLQAGRSGTARQGVTVLKSAVRNFDTCRIPVPGSRTGDSMYGTSGARRYVNIPCTKFRVFVDPENKLKESNELNNQSEIHRIFWLP